MLYITFLCDTYFITGRLFLLIGPYLAYLFSPTLLNRKKKKQTNHTKTKTKHHSTSKDGLFFSDVSLAFILSVFVPILPSAKNALWVVAVDLEKQTGLGRVWGFPQTLVDAAQPV